MHDFQVEFHPEALVEADTARLWYRAKSPDAADAFMVELDRAIELIQQAPQRWPRFTHGTRRYPLRRFPFSVIYRVVEDTIEVLAVAHAKKRPGYWANR